MIGYNLGVIAEVIAYKSFKSQCLEFNANSRSGTVVTCLLAVVLWLQLLAGFVGRLGHHGSFLLSCGVFVIRAIVQTAGVAISVIYVGRLIAGIGVGVFNG